jgi:hypothetical protein
MPPAVDEGAGLRATTMGARRGASQTPESAPELLQDPPAVQTNIFAAQINQPSVSSSLLAAPAAARSFSAPGGLGSTYTRPPTPAPAAPLQDPAGHAPPAALDHAEFKIYAEVIRDAGNKAGGTSSKAYAGFTLVGVDRNESLTSSLSSGNLTYSLTFERAVHERLYTSLLEQWKMNDPKLALDL